MKAPAIVRGYRVGKEYLDFCYYCRYVARSREDDGSELVGMLEPLEIDIGEMNLRPDLAWKFERIKGEMSIVRNNDGLCTKVGMSFIAPLLNPKLFVDHLVNAFMVRMCTGIREQSDPEERALREYRRRKGQVGDL